MMNAAHEQLKLPEWPNKKETSYCDGEMSVSVSRNDL